MFRRRTRRLRHWVHATPAGEIIASIATLVLVGAIVLVVLVFMLR